MRAAEIAREGKVSVLIKGSMSDGDLLAPSRPRKRDYGRTARLSHAYFVRSCRAEPNGLFVADAQLNVVPNLAAKKDIVANTVDLRAGQRHRDAPRRAAGGDGLRVTPAFVSTADAAALKTMAEQRMFGNAIADGPLTVDSRAFRGGSARERRQIGSRRTTGHP